MQIENLWSGWKTEKFIGEGSFGKVYKIVREDYGHTYTAALKVINIPQSQAEVETARNDGMADDSVTMYFKSMVEEIVDEFALMSKLKGNTNIVSYEDHAVIPLKDKFGWEIYIRMELLTPLFDYTKENTLSIRDVIKLGIDMCKALEVCQKYNIIHRDIKPENIFMSDIGDFKLGDFGIARQLEKTSSGMSKKGTYTYMAPEVYKGLSYNSNVDIYSLGIVLYRFLNNNRTPFLPDYPKPIRFSDKENANVLRLSGKELPKPCNAEGRLAEIVLKACSYNPEDRYESATDMRLALESIDYTEQEAHLIYPKGDTLVTEGFTTTNSQRDKDENNLVPEIDKTEGTMYLFKSEEERIKKEKEEQRKKLEEQRKKEEERKRLEAEAKEKARKEAEEREKARKEKEERERKEAEEKKKLEEESKRKQKEEKLKAKADALARKKQLAKEKKEKTPKESENASKKKIAVISAVSAVIVIIGIVVGIVIYQKSMERTVPDICNISAEKAENLLESQDLKLFISTSKYSESVDKDCIISQSISSGEVVDSGTTINVVLSLGVKTVEVPDIVNLEQEIAKNKLSNTELYYSIKSEYSSSVKKGYVISQSPKAGYELAVGESVEIVISKGIEQVEVPNVVGMDSKKAESAIKKAGLKYEIHTEYSTKIKKGKVISQSVSAKKNVNKGTLVKLVVSKGKKTVSKKKNTNVNTPEQGDNYSNNYGNTVSEAPQVPQQNNYPEPEYNASPNNDGSNDISWEAIDDSGDIEWQAE